MTDPRLLRSTESLLDSLQHHSFKLRQCLGKIDQEPQQYKELASLLRNLVCYAGKTEGIVWRLTERLNIGDLVHAIAYGQPVIPVSLQEHLRIAISYIQRTSAQTNKRSLKTIIKTEIAVQTQKRKLTYEKFIRLIAEEVGLSHEAEKLSPETVLLLEIAAPIVKFPQALLLLKNIGWLVVELAERVLESNSCNTFKRSPQDEDDGKLAIAVAVKYLAVPHSVVQVFRCESIVYAVSFVGFVTPDGLRLQITHGSTLLCVDIPCPSPCDELGTRLYVACYSSTVKKLKWLTPSASGLPVIVDLGWIDGSAFSTAIDSAQPGEGIIFSTLVVFSTLLSSVDLQRMCAAPPDSNLGLTIDSSEVPEYRDFP